MSSKKSSSGQSLRRGWGFDHAPSPEFAPKPTRRGKSILPSHIRIKTTTSTTKSFVGGSYLLIRAVLHVFVLGKPTLLFGQEGPCLQLPGSPFDLKGEKKTAR